MERPPSLPLPGAGLAADASRSLPRVFVATDGRGPLGSPPGFETGILLRDLDLATLLMVAERADVAANPPVVAVDLDSVEGLEPDEAGVRFVVRRLGLRLVVSRRPVVVTRAVELGALGLLRIFAFDSTGLGRSLEGHPRQAGVGSVVSPGPVIAHMVADDLAHLPRPVLAYGLIGTPALARKVLGRADSVVLTPACAAALVRGG